MKIKDFSYFKLDFNDNLIKAFNKMQNIYVLDNKYKLSFENVKDTLVKLYKYFENIE